MGRTAGAGDRARGERPPAHRAAARAHGRRALVRLRAGQDRAVLRRARRGAGAGSPANWAAWSTSHHLSYVLATLSRPDDDFAPSWRPRPGPPQRGRTPR
ncbi:hypothetical protein [Micromonospora zamorensis]|uniref:hypothetical protein n=1 Tax=Micromonospora zamorensis TaxID=709883 RepID=UPI0037A0E767